MTRFTVGDVVRMRGIEGPRMVVRALERVYSEDGLPGGVPDTYVDLVWFVDGKLLRESLASTLLEIATDPPQAEPTTLPDDEPSCKCGHDLATEHSEAGCLRGCAYDACVPPEETGEER